MKQHYSPNSIKCSNYIVVLPLAILSESTTQKPSFKKLPKYNRCANDPMYGIILEHSLSHFSSDPVSVVCAVQLRSLNEFGNIPLPSLQFQLSIRLLGFSFKFKAKMPLSNRYRRNCHLKVVIDISPSDLAVYHSSYANELPLPMFSN